MITGPKTLSVDDLLVGDIIFSMDALNQAMHVAVYSGKKADTHFITHAVSEPYNSVMTTRLKPDYFPYQVFRCKNFNLALQVTRRMHSWVKYGLSFSHDKSAHLLANFVDAIPFCHPKEGGGHQCARAEQDFKVIFYRYIAMASHPKVPFMSNALQDEGVRCSEAITMAYNIETLLCADAVKGCHELQTHWVTDKTTISPTTIQAKYAPHPHYWEYFSRVNNPFEYEPYGMIPENGLKDGHYPCSLAAWQYSLYPSIEEFVDTYPFHLPLDSKIVSSWGMMTYMQQHPELWQSLGRLSVPEIKYPLEALEGNSHKQEWKAYVLKLFEQRDTFHKDFTARLSQSSEAIMPELETSSELVAIESTRKRVRSLSLSAKDSYIYESAEEEGTQAVESVQAVIFRRASKYTSPEKTKIHRENQGCSPTTSSVKKRLF